MEFTTPFVIQETYQVEWNGGTIYKYILFFLDYQKASILFDGSVTIFRPH